MCVYPISSLKVSTAFTLYSQVTDPRLPGTLDPRTKTCCNWNILTFIKFQDLFQVIQISQRNEFLGLQTDSGKYLVVEKEDRYFFKSFASILYTGQKYPTIIYQKTLDLFNKC